MTYSISEFSLEPVFADLVVFRRISGAIFAASLLLISVVPTAAAANGVTTPMSSDVALQTFHGSKIPLSSLQTKITIVNFWASWCFPCRYEMPLLQKIHDRFKGDGLSVVAIAVDDEYADAKAYQTEKQFTFAMLFDKDGASKRVFGVDSVPETYIVGEDGALVPFRDPKTGTVSTMINDPTVWEGQAIIDFLADLVAR